MSSKESRLERGVRQTGGMWKIFKGIRGNLTLSIGQPVWLVSGVGHALVALASGAALQIRAE